MLKNDLWHNMQIIWDFFDYITQLSLTFPKK